MGKHIDVVTYRLDESPFGDELPVPGYIHRVHRPGAPGKVATMLVESVEVIDGEVRAVVTTWDGPLCLVPAGDDLDELTDPLPHDVPGQGALFSPVHDDHSRRSHPAGRTATLPRRAESPSGA
jgi:hypothetical protein